MKHNKYLLIPDEDWQYHNFDIEVVEERTDTPLGNFTGLYSAKGEPLFKPKNKIGFIVRK